MIVVDKNHIPERARQIPVFCDDLPNLREGLVSKNKEGARRRETDQCIELGLSGGEGEGAAVDVMVDVEVGVVDERRAMEEAADRVQLLAEPWELVCLPRQLL